MNIKQEKIQKFLTHISNLIDEYGIDSTLTLGEIREIFEGVFMNLSNETEESEILKDQFFVSREELLRVKSTMTENKFISWLHKHYEVTPIVPILTDEDLKEVDEWMKIHKY